MFLVYLFSCFMNDIYANWAKVYDYFYPDRSDEMDFWARQAEPYGRCLLDLMCGTAEVSLGLARSDFHVLGVDRSPAMLTVGTERLASAADYPARNLSLVQGDACAIPAPDAAFDFVMVGGSGSFNHLGDDTAPMALDELNRTLRPGGGLGLELVNPYLLKEIYPERTFSPFRPTPPDVWVEKTVANRFERKAGLFHIKQVTRYEITGEPGEFEEAFALRIWEPGKVQSLLEAAGFDDVQLYGGYNRGDYNVWSFAMLVVAQAPE